MVWAWQWPDKQPPHVQVVRELPAHTTLALLTVSGSVSVYHLRGPNMAAVGSPGMNGGPHIVTADCFPGMIRKLCWCTCSLHGLWVASPLLSDWMWVFDGCVLPEPCAQL